MQIAQEILRQLGGRRFIAMTGAKNLIGRDRGLSMKLPRNMSKANYLQIELNGLDYYNMIFKKINYRTLEVKEVKVFNDVDFTQLQGIFTEVTGMYTKL